MSCHSSQSRRERGGCERRERNDRVCQGCVRGALIGCVVDVTSPP